MTQEAGISALASFIIGLPGESVETLRKTLDFANELHQEFGSLYGFHVLAPFPGSEVRERAADYGLQILSDDWTQYDANHVVTCTEGAAASVIQEFVDSYEQRIKLYLSYQDLLYADNRLEGYEKKGYLRRRRQSLLWKLLLEDVIEALPAFQRAPVAELTAAVVAASGEATEFVAPELERVLKLGALVSSETRQGARFRWSE